MCSSSWSLAFRDFPAEEQLPDLWGYHTFRIKVQIIQNQFSSAFTPGTHNLENETIKRNRGLVLLGNEVKFKGPWHPKRDSIKLVKKPTFVKWSDVSDLTWTWIFLSRFDQWAVFMFWFYWKQELGISHPLDQQLKKQQHEEALPRLWTQISLRPTQQVISIQFVLLTGGSPPLKIKTVKVNFPQITSVPWKQQTLSEMSLPSSFLPSFHLCLLQHHHLILQRRNRNISLHV